MNGGNQNGGAYHRHPGHSGQQQRHTRVRFPEEFDAGDGDGGGGGGGGPFDLFARVFSTLTGLFFGAIASICLLGLLTILGILYVVVRPFSVSTYRRVANQLAASSFLDAMALLLPNMRLYLTGDSDVPSPVGTSILVCNHLMDGDWWPILMLGRCVGLRGSVKAILRNEILHLNVQNATANGSSNVNPSSNSAGQQETPRDRRSSTGAQLNTALLKQATAVLGGSMPNNNKNNNGIVPFVRTNTPEPLHTTGSNSSSPSPSSQTSNSGFNSRGTHHHTSRDLAILAKLLHAFMEFPLLNGEDYISDREHLFQLLRSFAENNGAEAPVHLLFFPEGWSLHNGADRRSILAMSNEFAKREGRPQLKHLLLPKTTGFNASLECLRESSPVVYDVTMVRVFAFSLPVLRCVYFGFVAFRH